MTNSNLIRDFDFNDETPSKIIEEDFYNGWPVVYVINNSKEMYIGETYHASERIKQHLKNPQRRKLNELHIFGNDNFTKSATLDIESSLIELCKLEHKRELQNANDGLVYHYYANKDYFRKDSKIFASIWYELKKRGLVEKDIENLLNSDLFKYSPYKALNAEQCTARDYILEDILDACKENKDRSIFVNGTAGTGKTILAVYLMKLLVTKGNYLFDNEEDGSDTLPFIDTLNEIKRTKSDLKVAYVVAMTSLRKTLKQVFSKVKGLKSSMVISPNDVVNHGPYDILIVDEAHRLMQRKNITNYESFDKCNKKCGLNNNGTQLDWILMNSNIQILFYDAEQSIKPTDISSTKFNELLNKTGNSKHELTSQMRCMGGHDYIKYVKDILNCRAKKEKDFEKEYDFRLFDNINDFCNVIYEKEIKDKLSRIVSGYGYEWISKKKNTSNIPDIDIQDRNFFWNKKNIGWPLSIQGKRVIEEVGCIHTVQGYDLNYCGVIFGPEIVYRNNQIEIVKGNYYDINGKNTASDEELKEYIINIYSVLLTRGIKGTYVYCCDNKLYDYFSRYIKTYK